MKTSSGPSMYPGAVGCRLLLCLLLVSTLFGNTYEQGVEGVQKQVSGSFSSTTSYASNGSNAAFSENDGLKVSLSLDDNNIMQSEILPNDGDIPDSEEYDERSQPVSSELEIATSIESSDITPPMEYEEVSNAGSIGNNSEEVDGKGNYMDEYEEYYEYDYENDTGLEDKYEATSEHMSDKIQTHPTSPKPISSESDDSADHSASTDSYSESKSETYDPDESTSMESSNKHYTVITNYSNGLPDKSVFIGADVVSVVTTKSVVNGTISIPVTPLPQTTEQISSPPSLVEYPRTQMERHQTTENSIVLASVQTSRSISGARFLPFPVVEQVEQVTRDVNGNTKTSGTSESTESIIDKLDRVQSELSNGFLSSGFRNSGNTLDVLSAADQIRRSKTTTMRTPVISKFVPHRYNGNRKLTTVPKSSSPLSTLKPIRTENRLNNTSATAQAFDRSSTTSIKSVVSKPQLPLTNKRLSEATPKTKSVIVQDISALLPPGYNPTAAKDEPTGKSILEDILAKAKVDASLLPPGYNNNPTNNESSRQENKQSPVEDILKKTQVDISSLLPPGYNKNVDKKDSSNTAAKQPVADGILKKTQVDISSLLPPGYKSPDGEDASDTTPKESLIDDIFKKSHVDLSSLLPPGYNPKKSNMPIAEGNKDTVAQAENKVTTVEGSTTEADVSTTKAGGLKVVFPSRPGGRKPIHRATTTSPLRGEAPGAFKPHIQKGWPVRATTEFTGWPSSSTTPISIEKLLEAARTATAMPVNTSSTSASSVTYSTTTTTTTTTTHRPTTPGICEEECEVAGTIRLVGNTTWVPELLDRNTIEWKQLADEVENEIDVAFAKSSTLRKWYKKIKIDSFSKGSILVDYFVELNEVGQKVNTQELKKLFHDSLIVYSSNTNNNSQSERQLVLGGFTIDPASTDFIVVPKFALPPQIDNENTLIPQWAIAVIVIGIGGLLFIIVFGIFVLTNRQNVAKIKPTMQMYDEEIEKNIIHKTQPSPIQRSSDHPKNDFYNMDAVWNDKSFDSTSNKMMMDGPYQDSSRYNPYDSWKSEWNGYYHNASHASSRSPGYDSTTNMPRHHHPDYDTNF